MSCPCETCKFCGNRARKLARMSENSYNSVTNLSETAQGVPPPHAASDQYSREGTDMANAHSIPISDSNSIDHSTTGLRAPKNEVLP